MNNYKVYLIRNKHGKIVYCGITRRELKERYDDHCCSKKIDRTHTIELVTEWLTQLQAADLERRLISQYDLIKNGLNKSPGSIDGNSQSHNEDQKKKWSLERKGKKVSAGHAEKNRIARLGKKNSEEHNKIISDLSSVPVFCVNNNTVYSSMRKAAEALGVHQTKVSAVCRGERKHTKGYIFKYYKEITEIDRNDQSSDNPSE